MAANNRSFAARIASLTSNSSRMESWDDGDFDDRSDGLLFKNSTVHSLSSRMSVRSESESQDDWQFLITPDDRATNTSAITTAAKQAGIPIPTSVPPSALLGGAIKRLGKKHSSKKMAVDDDWGNDLELPANASEGLKLKAPVPRSDPDDQDDDFDWGEGSLGIRFAGTRQAARGGAPSSSIGAMSPSLGSCMTMESEDDDLGGLVLPVEPMDFSARLEKLKKAEPQQASAPQPAPVPEPSLLPPVQIREQPTSTPPPTSFPLGEPPTSPGLPRSPKSPRLPLSPISPRSPRSPRSPTSGPRLFSPIHSPRAVSPKTKPKPTDDEDDFENGFELGRGGILDSHKLTLNKNIVVKKAATKSTAPHAARPATTITFTDRPTTSRIPRPLPSIASRTRLTPVYESGAPSNNPTRTMPTTTSAQLLRAKRSAPILRNSTVSQQPRMPFLPAGANTSQSHHVMAKSSSQVHLRRDSDPRRPHSPSMRSYSRSSAHQNENPSRAGVRRDLAPSALARHLPPKKLTQPQRKRNFGDGHELDMFDDLPTSATKEKQFEKVPRNVASNKTLRQQPSNSRMPMADRMATPVPQTPRSPPKMDHTPRFARDTAASRNAREQRLAGTRSRGEGNITQRPVSWAAQVAARSPHTSPSAQRKKGTGQKPQLIRQMTQPYTHSTALHHHHFPAPTDHYVDEKGMIYNPTLQRWEGNEEALVSFSHPNTSTTTLALTTASTPTFAPPGNQMSRGHDRSQSISHVALSSIHANNAHRSFSSRAAKLTQPPAPLPAPSPPRPALISQISVPRNVQYEGRMVFDPVKMTWLKAPRLNNDVGSPSEVDEDEDPFAGLDDLKDNESVVGGNGMSGTGTPNPEDPTFVGEEFDVGPGFIRRQRDEEAIWRRRVEGWVGGLRDSGEASGGWRWAIRDLAASASAGGFAF
ncbi:cytokinesis regulator [Pyrenophora seminiperda CCB06]|uniref:Cytokinesis regulator n=1 Tax=Pyrenophora seminiperda CCB06 TaxID=1302712 RepID=A0A3M7LY90_9PLEO|nr:cytokinesis regulator [Pyrenophora seminiperda CCB06]